LQEVPTRNNLLMNNVWISDSEIKSIGGPREHRSAYARIIALRNCEISKFCNFFLKPRSRNCETAKLLLAIFFSKSTLRNCDFFLKPRLRCRPMVLYRNPWAWRRASNIWDPCISFAFYTFIIHKVYESYCTTHMMSHAFECFLC